MQIALCTVSKIGMGTHIDRRQGAVLRRAADDAGVQHDQLDQLADLEVAVDLHSKHG